MNSAANDNQSGLSRRTVLRAGAHVAWVVPVVTIATASPAMADHSGHTTPGSTPGDVDVTSYSLSRENKTALSATGRVDLAKSGNLAATGVQVSVFIPNSGNAASDWNKGTLSATTSSTDWSLTSTTRGTTGTTFTFTRSGSVTASETLVFTVTSTLSGEMKNPAVSTSATVTQANPPTGENAGENSKSTTVS